MQATTWKYGEEMEEEQEEMKSLAHIRMKLSLEMKGRGFKRTFHSFCKKTHFLEIFFIRVNWRPT